MSSTGSALIEQYFNVILGRDTTRDLADFFSSDVSWRVPSSNPDISPNPRVGHAAVMDLLQNGVSVYEAGSMSLDMQPLIVAETHVVAQLTMHARLASGAPYVNEYCFVFALRDGRICAVTEYLDTLAQATQGTWDT